MKITPICTAIIIHVASLFCFAEKNDTKYIITDYGAKADGITNNAQMIQKAVDAAFLAGGGEVVVPPGEYLSGTIELKDNVTFHVEAGAVILGAEKLADYTEHPGYNQHGLKLGRRYLISVLDAENVTLCGKGTVDGQGKNFWNPYNEELQFIKAKPERPDALVEIAHSKNITIKDITLTNSANWTCHISESNNINISGINIFNDLRAPNSDGIDISGSSYVRVSDCNIRTGDDAIVIKTWKTGKPCEDITVTNCNLESLCAALKIGTESYQDFRRITFSNCTVTRSSRLFAIYVRDGAIVEDVIVSNISGDTNAPLVLNRPIQLMITKRHADSPLGSIKNIMIQNVICKTQGRVLMTADEGGTLKNIVLKNIHLDYPFIENPTPVANTTPSSQFPKNIRGISDAKAAIVAFNLTNLVIRDLTIDWPEASIPDTWKLPVRLENGSFDNRHYYTYDSSRQAEFHVLYGQKISGGVIENPLANSSLSKWERYVLKDSEMTILEDE